jgi:hypothetical protein
MCPQIILGENLGSGHFYLAKTRTFLLCVDSFVFCQPGDNAPIDLAYPDVRIGKAAIEANRRFYRMMLACELPVLILALVSWEIFQVGLLAGMGNQP